MSSFFYETDEGEQQLTELINAGWQDSIWTATYNTTDGRDAMIKVKPDGSVFEVSFRLDPETGILRSGERLYLQAEEKIHGLTERVYGNYDGAARDSAQAVSLERNGERVDMDVSATISLYAPFYQSSKGYGLYANNTYLGYFDVGAANDTTLEFAFQKPGLEYYIYTGENPIAIHQQYMQQIGMPLMPPRWALGLMRWRDDHNDLDTLYDGTDYKGPINSMVYEDVKMMELLDIPSTYYMIDRPWSEGSYGYGKFEWEEDRFPKAEFMLDLMQQKELQTIVWIAPWVNDEQAVEAMNKGYFIPGKGMIKLGITSADMLDDTEALKQAQQRVREALEADHPYGTEMASYFLFDEGSSWRDDARLAQMRDRIVNHLQSLSPEEFRNKMIAVDRGVLLVDFTNPEAVEWWQGYLQKVIDDGVKGFKLDRGDEIVPRSPEVLAYNGMSMEELHNYYPVLYAKATYDVLNRNYGDDLLVMPRAGYPGTQQYATPWGGDHENTWLGLRNAVMGAIRSAIIGFPFWGSDTGGYQKPTDNEIFTRWMAFSAFTPLTEVGPTTNLAPWSMPKPPHYDTTAIATFRLYAKLKEHMADYTYQLAQQAHEQGMPIIRPLFFHHPDDPQAQTNYQSFYYGDDFLVSPVFSPGQSSKEVYLPEGSWVDYWNPEQVFEGPITLTVETPVYIMPIFMKEGSGHEILNLEQLYQESYQRAAQRPDLPDGSELSTE